jgi:DNA-nicking Smr family endonuclease
LSEDAVSIPITEELDLHSFLPADAPSLVAEYVRAAREKGILKVRIVHGRGRGVQRAVVRRVLGQLEGVLTVQEAPPEDGGWGATLVTLAPLRPTGLGRTRAK